MTLILNEKAVEEILSSPAEDVRRSYARAEQDESHRALLEWALGRVRTDKKGRRRYSLLGHPDLHFKDHRERWDLERGVADDLERADSLALRLQEIRAMRPAGDTGRENSLRQASALRGLVAGTKGLSYDEIMRVLIQLASRPNLSAEYIVTAHPSRKGTPVVEGRYLLNRGIEDDGMLKRLAETSNRFDRRSEFED